MTRHLPAIGIWTGALDMVPSAEAGDLAAELECLGYGTVWIPEVVGRDPFIHLSMLLSATEELMGATGIANIWARDAVTTSCAAQTLEEAYPQRVLIGLGVSHRNLVTELRGHHYVKPLTAMGDYLDRLATAPFSAHRPEHPPPYLLAALRPRMLELAGSRTAGAHTYFVTPDHTAKARETLGPVPLLCVEQAVVLETEQAKAREIARRHTAVYLAQPNYINALTELGFTPDDMAGGGTDSLVDALVAWGDVDAIVNRIEAHLSAGADHVAVQSLCMQRRGVPTDQWRELAAPLASLRAEREETESDS